MKRLLSLAMLFVVSGVIIPSGCNRKSQKEAGADFYASNASHNLQEDVKSPLPEPAGFVTDLAKVLDDEAKSQLEKTLQDFKNRAQIDFYVVTVETTGEQSIFDYSLAVARGWKIGALNPDKAGLLLLVAINDRKWYIQISNALNKLVPDKEVGDLGSLMNAPFREKRYGEGLTKCVEAFIKVLSERRGSSR